MKGKVVIATFIFFYAMLHLAKIEVFPFYHFGMYSLYQPYDQEGYISYDLYVDQKKVDYAKMDFRKYTYINNTIRKFDHIKTTSGIDKSSSIVLKYLAFIGVHNKEDNVYRTYSYVDLDLKMKEWIIKTLKLQPTAKISIEKKEYIFTNEQDISKTKSQQILQ